MRPQRKRERDRPREIRCSTSGFTGVPPTPATATALKWGAAAAAMKRTIDGDHAVITEEEVTAVVDETQTGIDR